MKSPTTRRLGLLLVVALAAVGVLAGSASASTWGGAEQRLVDSMNAERRAAGLAPLAVDAELQRVARGWTDVMAREDRLYHNANLAAQVQRDWRRLGENVGWSQRAGAPETELVDRTHAMFMNSPGHRANVLRPEFNWVGVGVRVTASGKLWTTVDFMHGAGQAAAVRLPPLAPGEFRDVTAGPHSAAIKAIALRGVTTGCTAERFCPERQVTRAQMATFIVRALKLPPAGRDFFGDDNGSPHEAAINSLAAAGIANGCAPGRFCPNAPVARGQMASFLQRAWRLPTSTYQRFSDVLGSVHQPAINAIADAGITLGCADGRFCPSQPVRRAEMASFLARALRLV
ncbi:MAG TPA: S-layer homology domain-containing protein [Egibacteraceae bacterium]|nr:S-layer homology domain-containing protein [Egibacteraceae bacterium]